MSLTIAVAILLLLIPLYIWIIYIEDRLSQDEVAEEKCRKCAYYDYCEKRPIEGCTRFAPRGGK